MGAVVNFKALPYQLQVFRSRKERIFVGGGVGSGKTSTGSVWSLLRAKESPPGVFGIIAANTYQQLIDSTIRNLFRNLDAWGVPHRPTVLPPSARPFVVRIWNGSRWVEVLCRSLDAYENLAGLEAGWWWCDEAWQTTRKAIETLVARDRDRRMPVNQGLFTTQLDDPSGWMYEMFVEKCDPQIMEVLYAPTSVNEHNLKPDYVRGLRAMYSARLFKRWVEAKWVSLEAGQVYYAFDRQAHVQAHAEFNPDLPLLWTHDFNIGQGKPMSSALCQVRRSIGVNGWRPELVVFDELILDSSDTNDAVREFRERGWHKKLTNHSAVYVYGDASGRARDSRSHTTDYGILAAAGFGNQRVPGANPPLRDSHNSVNALLKNAAGDVRLYVHPRCRVLAKGLETVKLRTGAQYLEEETREQHVTTALRYLVHQEFPIQGPSGGTMPLPI